MKTLQILSLSLTGAAPCYRPARDRLSRHAGPARAPAGDGAQVRKGEGILRRVQAHLRPGLRGYSALFKGVHRRRGHGRHDDESTTVREAYAGHQRSAHHARDDKLLHRTGHVGHLDARAHRPKQAHERSDAFYEPNGVLQLGDGSDESADVRPDNGDDESAVLCELVQCHGQSSVLQSFFRDDGSQLVYTQDAVDDESRIIYADV